METFVSATHQTPGHSVSGHGASAQRWSSKHTHKHSAVLNDKGSPLVPTPLMSVSCKPRKTSGTNPLTFKILFQGKKRQRGINCYVCLLKGLPQSLLEALQSLQLQPAIAAGCWGSSWSWIPTEKPQFMVDGAGRKGAGEGF